MGKKDAWFAVDLDGTLAFYDGYKGKVIGEPIPRMVDRVKGWLEKGRKVKIMTARVGKHEGETEEDIEKQRKMIEDWTEEHIGTRLEVTNEKDYKMIQLWDDRCVQIIPNTGIPVRIKEEEKISSKRL